MPLRNHSPLPFALAFSLVSQGLVLLFCALFAFRLAETVRPFLMQGALSVLAGGGMLLLKKMQWKGVATTREAILILLSGYALLILPGTLPFLLIEPGYTISDALFLSISGYTATGTTVSMAALPPVLACYHSAIQWLGSLLSAIALVVMLTVMNVGGRRAMMPGSRPGAVAVPQRSMIRMLILLYLGLTIAAILMLRWSGMGPIDSLCSGLAILASGYYQGGAVPPGLGFSAIILMLFMLIAGYGMPSLLWMGTRQAGAGDGQGKLLRFYLLGFMTIALLCSAALFLNRGTDLPGSMSDGFLLVASCAGNCGLDTKGMSPWNDVLLPVVMALIMTGGLAASAGGGLKMQRIGVMFRSLWNVAIFNESRNNPLKCCGSDIDQRTTLSILSYIAVFGLMVLLGTLILSVYSNSLTDCAFLSITALANYGHPMDPTLLPEGGKVLQGVLMLLGRLEIYPLLLWLMPLNGIHPEAN
ncbi:MAG TPA: potassium transporter TrkG [Bacteroidales bacterium]|nr:potassium transporter TrkG [Bacteroidales bacterium]